MPKNSNRPGELVLENRHLLLIFLGVVALSGVFFAFGYIVGRNTLSPSAATALAESGNPEGAAKPSPMPPALYFQRPTQPAVPPAEEPGSSQPELQFDQSLSERTPETRLESPESTGAAAASSPAQPSPPDPPSEPARQSAVGSLPPGILVQVSALSRQEDAERLVQLLKEKKLPVLVTTGPNDTLFHVVVGPYPSDSEAQRVKRLLEEDGFQPIIKR